MKIVMLISSLSCGGAEKVTANLANYLYNNKLDVSVITMSDVKDTYEISNKIEREFLLKKNEKKNALFNNMLRYKRLKQYVKKHKDVDCYIAMLPIPIFMMTLLRKKTNAKIIISERNNPCSHKLYEKIIMKIAQKKCDGLVVQTSEIGKWYNVKNKVIIPNAINDDILTKKSSENVSNKIVSVGRLEKQKNYPMLLKAFSLFLKNNPNYTLEIYGQGSLMQKLVSFTENLEISNKVVFKGYVKNIVENILDSKMFIMTSNFEGMPNALIEAMCLGLPCISTDCDGGGAKELIENNINGLLIKKNDVQALVNAMNKIANDDEFAKKLSNNAKKLENCLSSEYVYGKWLEFINKICM